MSSDIFSRLGCLSFSDETITILGSELWINCSIKNKASSSGNVTITGTTDKTIGGKKCGSITLAPGESIVVGNSKTNIDGITIAVPSSTECDILCYDQIQII